jgi:hypothetical protein
MWGAEASADREIISKDDYGDRKKVYLCGAKQRQL